MQRLTDGQAPKARKGVIGTIRGWFGKKQEAAQNEKAMVAEAVKHHKPSVERRWRSVFDQDTARPCYRYRAKARRARKSQRAARRVQRQHDPRFRDARAA
jgi:hypothetical protein